MDHSWTWASLNGDQLELVKRNEQAIQADYLLAFQQDEHARKGMVEPFLEGLRTADLEPGDVERLQALENQLGAVLIAYRSGR